MNIPYLYFGHLRNSRKILVVASIGLICALTIISSTNYYFDNSKKSLLDEYFEQIEDDPYSSSDLIITSNYQPPYKQNQGNNLLNLITETAQEFEIDYFKSFTITEALNGLFVPISYTYDPNNQFTYDENSTAMVVELNEELRKELVILNEKNSLIPNSKLPSTEGVNPEIYILSPSDYKHYESTQIINQSSLVNLYDSYYDSSIKSNVYQVKLTGFSSLSMYQQICDNSGCHPNPDFDKYPFIQHLRYSSYYWSEMIIFTPNLTEFSSMLKPVTSISNSESPFYTVNFFTSININFDYNKIDPYNSGPIVNEINAFRDRLYDNNYNLNTYIDGLGFDFRAQYRFQTIINLLTGFLFALLLVSMPVLIATIFVINYSFGLIHKNVVRHIGVYKTRGATSWMIFLFHLIDNILIIIFSSVIALFLGVPLSMLVIQTDSLLSFNYGAPTYYILNYEALATTLLYSAILFTIIVNFKRVRKLSRMTIVETEQPVEKEEPSWKRHNYDIIMFSFGMVSYVIFYTLVKNPDLGQALGPIIGILAIIMIPAPFALVLGLVLLVNRLIPVILNKIGTQLWEKTGDLIAFSFKNVIRHRQASTRAVMLIAILLAFLVFFYSLPYSAIYNNEQSLYYSNGAEVVGSFGDGTYNETSLAIIEQNYSQYLESFSPYVLISSANQGTNYALLLVNTTTYLDSAYLKFDLGLTRDINQDFKDLKKDNSSDLSFLNVLIDEKSMKERKSGIGYNLTVRSSNSEQTIKLNIIDSFRNWPILKYKFQYWDSMTLVIGDISYYTLGLNKTLANSPFPDQNDRGILFNFKDGVNQTLVSSWIEGNTSITIRSLTAESQKQFYTGIQFRLQVGQINNDVIMVIAISITVLIMFAYLQLSERRKEIFTERAMGMKLHQIASLFFIETIILSFTSILLGLGVGVFLMELLALLILNPLQTYPAYEIIFPIEIILITNLLILISSLIVSVVPAYYVTKQDISKSFVEG